jgi:hypothetical protein
MIHDAATAEALEKRKQQLAVHMMFHSRVAGSAVSTAAANT